MAYTHHPDATAWPDGKLVFHDDSYGDEPNETGGMARTQDFDPAFDGREPYLYDPESDLLHWGMNGAYHANLERDARDWYARQGLPAPVKFAQGAVIVNPEDENDVRHALYSKWVRGHAVEDSEPIRERIEQLVGHPITGDNADDLTMDEQFAKDYDWGNFGETPVSLPESPLPNMTPHEARISSVLDRCASDFDWGDLGNMQADDNVWQYRVPFYVDDQGQYLMGEPGQNHTALDPSGLSFSQNLGQYQGEIRFNPEIGEQHMWPAVDAPEHVKGQIISDARQRWQGQQHMWNTPGQVTFGPKVLIRFNGRTFTGTTYAEAFRAVLMVARRQMRGASPEQILQASQFGTYGEDGQPVWYDPSQSLQFARFVSKTAMADRTGNSQVDALIEEFLRTPMGDWTSDDSPYEALRDPAQAHGACQEVTEHFVQFAKAKGFKAYVTHTDMDELGYQPQGEPHGEVMNEHGEITQGFYPEHTIATIVVDDPQYPYGKEYYIDFTATQYGYTDHPKVTSHTARSSQEGRTGHATSRARVSAMPWKFDLSRAVNQASYMAGHILRWGTPEYHQKMLQNYPEITEPNYEAWEAKKFQQDVPHGEPHQWTNRYPDWEAQQQIDWDNPNAVTPEDQAQNAVLDLQHQQPSNLIEKAQGLTNALKQFPPMNVEGDVQRAVFRAFMEMHAGMRDRAYDELFRAGLNETEISWVLADIASVIAGWQQERTSSESHQCPNCGMGQLLPVGLLKKKLVCKTCGYEAPSNYLDAPPAGWDVQHPESGRSASRREAMPYEDNTWYHVTDASRLPQIAQNGLVGSEQGTDRVWEGMPVEHGAVYMWPNVAQAHSYMRSFDGRLQRDPNNPNRVVPNTKWQNPVILRVHGVDRRNLAPDHETYASWMDNLHNPNPESYYFGKDDIAREISPEFADWLERDHREYQHPGFGDSSNHENLQYRINQLRQMPPEFREQIARHLADSAGEPVMHYGPIHPDQISVGRLNEMNDDNNWGRDLWEHTPDYEQWSAENPQPDYEDDDAYEQWLEAEHEGLDNWASQQGNWVTPEEMEDWHEHGIYDPTDDSPSHSFTWTPIRQHLKLGGALEEKNWWYNTDDFAHTQLTDPDWHRGMNQIASVLRTADQMMFGYKQQKGGVDPQDVDLVAEMLWGKLERGGLNWDAINKTVTDWKTHWLEREPGTETFPSEWTAKLAEVYDWSQIPEQKPQGMNYYKFVYHVPSSTFHWYDTREDGWKAHNTLMQEYGYGRNVEDNYSGFLPDWKSVLTGAAEVGPMGGQYKLYNRDSHPMFPVVDDLARNKLQQLHPDQQILRKTTKVAFMPMAPPPAQPAQIQQAPAQAQGMPGYNVTFPGMPTQPQQQSAPAGRLAPDTVPGGENVTMPSPQEAAAMEQAAHDPRQLMGVGKNNPYINILAYAKTRQQLAQKQQLVAKANQILAQTFAKLPFAGMGAAPKFFLNDHNQITDINPMQMQANRTDGKGGPGPGNTVTIGPLLMSYLLWTGSPLYMQCHAVLIHEIAHLYQTPDVIANDQLREGGATAFAAAMEGQVWGSQYSAMGDAGSPGYDQYKQYVEQTMGQNWIMYTQFGLQPPGGQTTGSVEAPGSAQEAPGDDERGMDDSW